MDRFIRTALLGMMLGATLQVFADSNETGMQSVIGQQFDVEKIAAIGNLVDECDVLKSFEEPLSDSCTARLSNYFSGRAVWEQSVFYYPMLDRFRREAPTLNRKPYALAFSMSDVTGDVPLWRDIFDGKVGERAGVVVRVFQDETCRALSNPGAIRTDLSLADRCQSRELVKYAIYLDACLTGIERINNLLARRMRLDGMTRYEHVTSRWDRLLSEEESEVAKADLTESMMHAIWMRNACAHIPAEGYDDAFRSYGWNPEGKRASDMAKELQNTHDAAMAIAARSGDVWAIQGFYVRELRVDGEYWKSLFAFSPLLFHRWMTEVGSANGLSEEEIAMHALKAYDLEKHILDDSDRDKYLERHRLSPTSNAVLSVIDRPMEDDQLLKRWREPRTLD